MQVAMDAPSRPALRYYGGKWNLAPWIISFFPPHLNYVEPCCGACSVLLQKPRSPLETVNDLDGNVVNFFRVLRDQPDELIRKIRLTPWAREEFEICRCPVPDPIETARRFFISALMGVSNQPHDQTTGMRFSPRREMYYSLPVMNAIDLVDEVLVIVCERIRGVQIENEDYKRLIARHDWDTTLIYMDPPYIQETRANGRVYLQEWSTANHIEAADILHDCQGYVVISGYACPLYADLYERHGWQRHDKEAQTNSGGKRVESVWLSPRTAEALARPQQQGLFAL